MFFIIRAGFEYGADVITSQTFGSDGMPAINFVGVTMHEVCLSVMITSIKHPLVFVALILSDVMENSFCLFGLWRNTRKSSRVSPEEVDDTNGGKKKSLVRRSSSILKLSQDKEFYRIKKARLCTSLRSYCNER